jgi:hypothetical protein
MPSPIKSSPHHLSRPCIFLQVTTLNYSPTMMLQAPLDALGVLFLTTCIAFPRYRESGRGGAFDAREVMKELPAISFQKVYSCGYLIQGP